MFNKEIGSEFWDIPLLTNNSFNDLSNVNWYISGRAALFAIISDIKKNNKVTTAALPSWCCDSMIKPFLENGIQVVFYSVFYENGNLCRKLDNIQSADVLLVMDYFGFSRFNNEDFSGVKICDITHSVFSKKQQKADYYFGSLRKWAGFYTGGFAYKKGGKIIEPPTNENLSYTKLRKTAMEQKENYISGKSNLKDYLSVFSNAEEMLETCKTEAATERDIKLSTCLNVDFIRNTRRKNAEFLLKNLKAEFVFNRLEDTDCPLFVPIILPTEKRDALRKHLVENQIYCPVHWPITPLHNLSEKEKMLYNGTVSIVCDQRYTIGDMERISKKINNFI